MACTVNCLKCGTCIEKPPGLHVCKKCLGEAEVLDTRGEEMSNICKECEEPSVTLIQGVCNTCVSRKDESDVVDYPKHYNTGKIQPIDVIEDWKLDFRLANAVKYIARHDHKGSAEKDLEKAIWYIQRYIDKELKSRK